jgi:broad specificity phosphatase PhoE
MPPRLTFVANASTSALRAAKFPLDEGLDEIGKREAAAKADQFKAAGRAIVSPARSALETAEILGLNAGIEPALRDLDVGRWAGCSLSDLAASEPEEFASWLSDPDAAPHGGETIVALFARISIWLQSMTAQSGFVVAVTHPAVVRAAILAAIHAGPTSFWNVDVGALGVVELTSNGRRWALKSMIY